MVRRSRRARARRRGAAAVHAMPRDARLFQTTILRTKAGRPPQLFQQLMKTIVYFENGGVEATTRADEFVAAGRARYATPEETGYAVERHCRSLSPYQTPTSHEIKTALR